MVEHNNSSSLPEPHFYERVFQKCVSNIQAPCGGGLTFRLLSYNLLAKHNAQGNASHALPHPDGELVRRKLALQEILHWDPDVICAQEVCDFSELAGSLAGHGYQGAHVPSKFNKKDTCATFWKTSRFVCCSKQEVYYAQQRLKNNVALLVHLRRADVGNGQPMEGLNVANTHLLFNAEYGDGAHQLGQLRVLLGRMSKMSQAVSCGGVPAPCVLAGDLNAAPGSAVYHLLEEGLLHLNRFDVANVSVDLKSAAQRLPAQEQQPQQHQQQKTSSQPQHPESCTHSMGSDTSRMHHQLPQTPQQHRLSEPRVHPNLSNDHSASGSHHHPEREAYVTLQAAQQQQPSKHSTHLSLSNDHSASGLLHPPQRAAQQQEPDRPSKSDGFIDWQDGLARLALGVCPNTLPPEVGWRNLEARLAARKKQAQQGLLTVRSPMHLQSTYASVNGSEPEFTTCHNMEFGTVDYVWYTPSYQSQVEQVIRAPVTGDPEMRGAGDRGLGAGGAGGSAAPLKREVVTAGLHPLRVLLPPDRSRFPAGMPNPRWPSDHISLVCDFLLY